MYYVESSETNPYFNLAAEEYCFQNLDEDVFMLWQNDNTIVVGKYQNTAQEISNLFVNENEIKVVRRLSGGGAVYHDLGNLNFTFIQNKKGNEFTFEYFTQHIINILSKLSVKAKFNSRNDLVIGSRKFSGNSQYIKKDKILHHGTLLFDSNLETLVHALNVSNKKIESKAIRSVHQRVTNIRPHLKEEMEMKDFKDIIRQYFVDLYDMKNYVFDHNEMEAIKKLAAEKYAVWEWNYGESPTSQIRKEGKCDSGQVEIYLQIEQGMLKDISMFGDFFALEGFEKSLDRMIGKKYSKEELGKYITELADNIMGIESDWLLDLIVD